jgi:hypothetical protein
MYRTINGGEAALSNLELYPELSDNGIHLSRLPASS